MNGRPLSWIGIVRLGLVQTALGAIVVLTTSTMNRVMVVELALPASLPGLLVGLHYAIQLLRPRLGYGSDVGGRPVRWIVGGMGVLAIGGVTASLAIGWMVTSTFAGIALAVCAFVLIGLGVGAAGTTLLVLLAKQVGEERRAAAASITWIMMIVGFIVTAGVAGHYLDPFSPSRLVAVTAAVALLALLVTVAATWNIDAEAPTRDRAFEPTNTAISGRVAFWQALQQVWAEPAARRFTVFVFVSMLAYSLQDLILEPFAGLVFGFSPGESTQLAGVQHSGVLIGMLLAAAAGSLARGRGWGSLRAWTIGGCISSALALMGLAMAALVGEPWPLRATVFALGAANGAFAAAAIGSMMALAGKGRSQREGTRMGLWGASQAIAFGAGGILGAVAIDVARALIRETGVAYATVFGAEAGLFLIAAAIAMRLDRGTARNYSSTERGRHVLAGADHV
ncbi:MAG: BCD family MFS transporter [Burkholderiaceae bacterium]